MFQNSNHRHTAAEIDFTLSQHTVNKGHLEDGTAVLKPYNQPWFLTLCLMAQDVNLVLSPVSCFTIMIKRV